MSGSLRPDLHGEVLYLSCLDTMALLPDETATLTVCGVWATNDPEWVDVLGEWSGPTGDDPHARVEVRAASLPAGGGSVDMFITLQPGQWRAVPLPDGSGECPDEGAPLDVQLVRDKLRVVVDESDRPTGEVAAEGWWPRPGEPAPQLVHLFVLAEVLPDGAVPHRLDAAPGELPRGSASR